VQVGSEGFWYQYIKELDRQRARGVQAVESPLLWSDEELADLLQVGVNRHCYNDANSSYQRDMHPAFEDLLHASLLAGIMISIMMSAEEQLSA
jgi:hypothetical protein